MKTDLFQPGDTRRFAHTVSGADVAGFDSGIVHPVYSTFALARDAEWSGRLFVLELKEEGEEGIGTGLSIEHHAPALLGQEVVVESEWVTLRGNEVHTSFRVTEGHRLIATGTQTQKVLPKAKLDKLFAALG